MIKSNEKYPFMFRFNRFKESDIRKIRLAKRVCSLGLGHRLALKQNTYFFKFTKEGNDEFFKRLGSNYDY